MNLRSIFEASNDFGYVKKEEIIDTKKVVIDLVISCLPEFISENRKCTLPERGFTQRLLRKLSIHLNDSYPFFFDKDGMQNELDGKSPSVDLEVISKENIMIECKTIEKNTVFFAFEAKVLGVKDIYREKEYVIGRDKPSGGIERFKKNIHCRNLKFAGMC